MNLEKEINKKGFIFNRIEISDELNDKVLSSNEPTPEIKKTFLNFLKEIDSEIKDIHCVYEDIKEGMFHEMHSHLTPSRYQVIFWFPKSDYVGREFLFGTRRKIESFKPTNKDFCFMKTNDLNFIHGVAPLGNNTLVRTLLISVDHATNNGEHLTVSAKSLKDI
jgi:hypothetical protein